MRRTPLAVLAAAVASAAVLATLTAPVTAQAEPAPGRAPLRYVALGDSFSAASGVLPPDPGAPLPCLRSTNNYPHVIARRTGARLTDVTCGGAETGDYFARQYPGVPRQLDALDARTELVTMTIGGNDGDVFTTAFGQCAQLGLQSLGRGNPCEQKFGTTFVDQVRKTTYPNLVKALQDVRKKAPKARVAISGYLQILSPTGCFPIMPVASGDVAYLNGLQATLNDAVKRAAARTGATYLDVTAISTGHDACQLPGTRWVEPVIPVNAAPVHPNAIGEREMANNAIAKLGLARV